MESQIERVQQVSVKARLGANPTGFADSQAEDILQDGCVNLDGLRAEFGIGRSHAYNLMSAGVLPFTTAGNRRRLVPRRAVREMLSKNMVGATGVEAVAK